MKEMPGKLKSDLSHLANCYLSWHRPSPTDLKNHKTLKTLRKNKDIVILKPDKGNGVIVMNSSDYDSCVLKIISNPNKFNKLNEDPTILREGRLQRFLRELKKKGFWIMKLKKISTPKGLNQQEFTGFPNCIRNAPLMVSLPFNRHLQLPFS